MVLSTFVLVCAIMARQPQMLQMSAVETGQVSSVQTGQMSAVETGQISAVETGQMSTGKTGCCPTPFISHGLQAACQGSQHDGTRLDFDQP